LVTNKPFGENPDGSINLVGDQTKDKKPFEYKVNSDRPSRGLYVYWTDDENQFHARDVYFVIQANLSYGIHVQFSDLDDRPFFGEPIFDTEIVMDKHVENYSWSVPDDDDKWEERLLAQARKKGIDVIRTKSEEDADQAIQEHGVRYTEFVEESLVAFFDALEKHKEGFESALNPKKDQESAG